jgi:hypothetical protein
MAMESPLPRALATLLFVLPAAALNSGGVI